MRERGEFNERSSGGSASGSCAYGMCSEVAPKVHRFKVVRATEGDPWCLMFEGEGAELLEGVGTVSPSPPWGFDDKFIDAGVSSRARRAVNEETDGFALGVVDPANPVRWVVRIDWDKPQFLGVGCQDSADVLSVGFLVGPRHG